MKRLIGSLLLLVAGVIWGQDCSGPGRFQVNNPCPLLQLSGDVQALIQPDLTPITQSSSAIAEAITPDIQSLANNLGGDPVRIFNYVHDQIRYVHYFGSKKGATLTLLERSGNDFDQCALLAALLQASGYQHTPGSPFWPLLHPLPGGGGGYSQCAIPAGAPPN